MTFDRTTRTLLGIAFGGLGSLVVSGVLVGIRGEISNVNVALVLVLVVLAAANFGGRAAGAWCGLVAALSFDFFHTRPYGLLKIARMNDLVTTLLLLVVGLVMGEVTERSTRFKDRMKENQRQLRRLQRVAGLAASADNDERDLVLSVSAELIDTLRLDDCRFELPPFLSDLPRLEPDGELSGSSRRSGPLGVELPGPGVDLRVVGRRGIIGRFVLVPNPGAPVPPERLLVAVALAQALGLALTPAST